MFPSQHCCIFWGTQDVTQKGEAWALIIQIQAGSQVLEIVLTVSVGKILLWGWNMQPFLYADAAHSLQWNGTHNVQYLTYTWYFVNSSMYCDERHFHVADTVLDLHWKFKQGVSGKRILLESEPALEVIPNQGPKEGSSSHHVKGVSSNSGVCAELRKNTELWVRTQNKITSTSRLLDNFTLAKMSIFLLTMPKLFSWLSEVSFNRWQNYGSSKALNSLHTLSPRKRGNCVIGFHYCPYTS